MNNSQVTPTQIQTNPEPTAPELDPFPDEADSETPASPEPVFDEPDPEAPGTDPGRTSPSLPPELDPEILDNLLLFSYVGRQTE